MSTRATESSGASRRDFLKGSAAVGGALAGGLALARSVHAAGDDTIKVGLIGCGGRGSGAASDILHAPGAVKLVAAADAFEDNLNNAINGLSKDPEIGGKVDVPPERRFAGFDGYKKVLEAGVDLVILATPPGFRPIHFTAAVNANKHVFMEKPVAVDGTGVRQVLEATRLSKEKKLAVGVGLQRHHDAGYIDTIKRIQDGAIGEIVTARAYWNNPGVWVRPRQKGQTEMQYQMRNWYYFNWLCGDHIVEQHIHNLDVINWVKNAHPIAAQGMGGREVRKGAEHGEIYDHHAVEFEYADGTRLFSYCRHIPNCWESVSEHVHGTKGYSDISANVIQAKGEQPWSYDRKKVQNAYRVEHVDLLASIRSGQPINEGEYGAMSSMTSILGRLATYSGKIIRWDEAINSSISLAPKSYAWDAEPPVAQVAVPGRTAVI